MLFQIPSCAQIDAVLRASSASPFTYAATGCTRRDQSPCGFFVDRLQTQVGSGRKCYEGAVDIVQRGAFFPPAMTVLHKRGDQLNEHDSLATVYSFPAGRIWLLMPARVVYTFDQRIGRIWKSGWALGTVAGHPECGEERFEVSWNRETNDVAFSIHAVSRPSAWFAWLSLPFVRFEQARFRRLACDEVKRAMKLESLPVRASA